VKLSGLGYSGRLRGVGGSAPGGAAGAIVRHINKKIIRASERKIFFGFNFDQ